MNRAILGLLFLFVSVGCQSTSGTRDKPAHHTGDADAKAGVLDAGARYTDALLKKDLAALERLWADDLVFINPRGQVQTKAQRLADLRSGATRFTLIDLQDISVTVCGHAAIHVSRGKIQGQYSGTEGSGDYRIIVALCRHGTEWRIHSVQMTPIAQ
jgi:ketosteroid isomerase-like protein